jgi:serine/threonine-protein kinase
LPLEVMQKELKAGARIASQYVLERELGAGGMGVVWAAERVADGTKVALKFLRSDRPLSERVCQRFLQEARATRGIDHPGVVQIHDVVEDDSGLPVLVMDLLVGETLASHLEQKGPMKAEDAIALLLPAAEAVAAAHDRRIIHRDLKPENLFLCTRDGSAPEVRVLDFGIAKVMRDDGDGVRSGVMTSTGVVMGTPFYMAPEQLFSEGNIDERADVWAFGVILYECIAGRRPFSGPSVGQVLRLIALDAYTPLSQAAENGPPDAVCDLVARLLARERSQRPRTMRDVEHLLRQVLDGSYECISPFAETLRLDAAPMQQVAADVVRPASSGDQGAVSASSAGVRTDASLRTRRARAVWFTGAGLIVAAASIGAIRFLAVAPADTAASVRAGSEARAPASTDEPTATAPTAHPVAPLASLALPATPASTDPARAVVDAPQSQTKPVAARLPAQHAVAKVDASAPVASAAASTEPARRPGSVVDVPPF